MKTCFWICGLCLLVFSAQAQTAILNKKVTFKYSDIKLKEALSDIGKVHDVKFSYSSSYIPTEQKITAKADNQPLSIALSNLFEETEIVYASIGNQVVLKIDKNKKNRKEILEPIPPPRKIMKGRTRPSQIGQSRYKVPKPLEPLERSKLEKIQYSHYENVDRYRLPVSEIEMQVESFRHPNAQISIIPNVGANTYRSADKTNNLSLNVLWGTNRAVNGLEVGGFVNTVIEDVRGVQLAGLINHVGGHVEGSKLITEEEEYNYGIQGAGLVNVANSANAIQVSGLANIVYEDFKGIQISMGVNSVEGSLRGVQISGIGNLARSKENNFQAAILFNSSKILTKSQITLGVNLAEEIDALQIGLFNKASHVKGRQIGLINICDSVSHSPIGLFNIVKAGENKYNKVEIAASNILHLNAGLKFGTKKLYNIVQLGSRFYNTIEEEINTTDPNIEQTTSGNLVWALGYGLGTTKTLGQRFLINGELTAMHINELEFWTSELNLLTQLKLTLDFQLTKKFSLFIGPTYNILVSRLKTDLNETRGSAIITNAFYDKTNGDKHTKMSIGINAGFRF